MTGRGWLNSRAGYAARVTGQTSETTPRRATSVRTQAEANEPRVYSGAGSRPGGGQRSLLSITKSFAVVDVMSVLIAEAAADQDRTTRWLRFLAGQRAHP
jgi:hypothetical protein